MIWEIKRVMMYEYGIKWLSPDGPVIKIVEATNALDALRKASVEYSVGEMYNKPIIEVKIWKEIGVDTIITTILK